MQNATVFKAGNFPKFIIQTLERVSTFDLLSIEFHVDCYYKISDSLMESKTISRTLFLAWNRVPTATVARPTSGPTVASHTDFTVQLGRNHEKK